MPLSKNDLLSIKDFSQLTGIKQSTLRYYDELGLFSPAKREENGYRYYSPQQIITINSIKLLHELDMPIRKISEIQQDRTPELLFSVLSEKEETLRAEIAKLESSFNVVTTLKRMIQIGLSLDESIIETRYFDELPLVIGPRTEWGNAKYFYDSFLAFCAVSKQYRIDLRLPVGGMFDSFETLVERPGRPTNFFSVDPKGLDKRPAGKYVSALQRCYYGDSGDLIERKKEYMDRNGLTPVGPVYHIYLHDELSLDDPDKYLLHSTVAVA